MFYKPLNSFIFFLISIVTTTVSCQAISDTSKSKTSQYETDSIRERQQLVRERFWNNLPQPVNYLSDYENIYSDSEEIVIDSIIADFNKKTQIQIAVVTFDTMMIARDSVDALTLKIANFWGVGQKEKNNGVTIGICKGHKRMSIQNGYGIEKILTNEETKKIIDEGFIPGFREEKYFYGTLNGLKTLMAALVNNTKEKISPQ